MPSMDVSLEMRRRKRWPWSANRAAASPPSAGLLLRLIEPTSRYRAFDGRDLGLFSECEPAPGARRRPADLPGPLRLAQSTHDGRRDAGRAAASAAHRPVARRAAAERVARALVRWACGASTRSAIRTSFPAASVSASAIARALAVEPKLIVCDEPVSALDVSIRSQILNLLAGPAAAAADLPTCSSATTWRWSSISPRAWPSCICGRIVESATRDAIFAEPRHPHTQALLSAVPVPSTGERKHRRLLPGDPPARSILRPAAISTRAAPMRKISA